MGEGQTGHDPPLRGWGYEFVGLGRRWPRSDKSPYRRGKSVPEDMGGLRAGVVKIPGSQRRKPGPRLGPLHLVAETSQEVVAGRDDTIEL